MAFSDLSDRLTASFKRLRSRGVLTESDVDQTISEIRRALIDADVALPVVRQFTTQVREKAYGAARSRALNPGQQVVRIVHDELVEILGGETRELHFAQRGPTVFMLAGLQGAGKTTLAGKLGKWLREEGKSVLLVASDLQRPNAVGQLQIVGERAGGQVWAPEPGNGVGDPVQVARSGLDYAITHGIDVVIVDTAGRLGVDQEMMDQAIAIRQAVNPHVVMFVLDAMIGQDAVNTATAFRDGVGFTGVVLSKLDGDSRGGAALSVRGVTGAPILFASTGEGLDDFERFHADRMASRILDMGDIMTLIEQAEKRLDAEEAEKMLAGKANVSYLEYSQVPVFNQDLESPILPVLTEVREQILAADAIWIFSPVYNFSIPGPVKNLLDWLSRALDLSDPSGPSALQDKIVTVSSVANGGHNQLFDAYKELLPFIRTQVVGDFTATRVNDTAWVDGKFVVTEEVLESLQNQAEALIEAIKSE